MLEEHKDYYFNEEGYMVFTADYHQKRGYCCENSCLNCPWNYGQSDKEERLTVNLNTNGIREGNPSGKI
ncbi:DUF5522 domain-containing protein [Arcticibacter sp.]|jgi:hypothetical protein|uniref:DUF5522 domain-containing protein n=1 Tax=Arcticibacter sp. TaxID=1872630 RepID=UPI0038902F00